MCGLCDAYAEGRGDMYDRSEHELQLIIERKNERLAELAKATMGLRELLRDVHDVLRSGEPVSEGLLARIAAEMAIGR